MTLGGYNITADCSWTILIHHQIIGTISVFNFKVSQIQMERKEKIQQQQYCVTV